jgi:predicted anti-sigma-YlaC factor YlaD
MEHFTTEKWIDFVNQAVAVNEKVLMEKHLGQGCKRCMETVSLWQKVRQSAAVERDYQPPEDSVRLAKAAFAGAGLKGQRKGAGSRIKVLFDSFLQPVFEGARSAGTTTRQMLYRADPFQIDVQLEAKPRSGRIVVTGQLLDLSNPEIIARNTRILLSNMRGQVAHTVANQFGEFSGEIDNSGDLQMTFASPGGQPIVISLREALGHLPEEKA